MAALGSPVAGQSLDKGAGQSESLSNPWARATNWGNYVGDAPYIPHDTGVAAVRLSCHRQGRKASAPMADRPLGAGHRGRTPSGRVVFGRRPIRAAAVLIVAVFALASCQAEPGALNEPQLTNAELSPQEILDARRFRELFGLRADDAWIRQVAADPTSEAGETAYGVPLTPAERADLDQRADKSHPIAEVIEAYGSGQPDWGGLFIDQTLGGIVVGLFTDQLDLHREAIRNQLYPGAAFEVRKVRWTLAKLQALAARILEDREWLGTVAAAWDGSGVDIGANVVVLRISSANAAASDLITAHYEAQGQLRVESDGTGPILLPPGTLVVTARDARGRPVPGLDCVPIPDVAGAFDGGIGYQTNEDGVCEIPVRATGYEVRVETSIGGERVTVGSGRTVVPPNGRGLIEILITYP